MLWIFPKVIRIQINSVFGPVAFFNRNPEQESISQCSVSLSFRLGSRSKFRFTSDLHSDPETMRAAGITVFQFLLTLDTDPARILTRVRMQLGF